MIRKSGKRILEKMAFRKDPARGWLKLGFLAKLEFVFQAVIARQAADELAALPVVEDAADLPAGDPGQRRKIALADLLADDDPAGADLLAEILRQFEKRTGDPAAQRQEAS